MNVGYYSASDHDRLERQRPSGKRSFVIYTKPDGEYAICTGVRRHDDKPPLAKDTVKHGEVCECVLSLNISDTENVDVEQFTAAWESLKRHSKNRKSKELFEKLESSLSKFLKVVTA